MSIDHPQRNLLLAYVDGVLEDSECQRAETLINEDDTAAEFVHALQASSLSYDEVMQPLLEQPIPPAIADLIEQTDLTAGKKPVRFTGRYGLVASLCAGVAIGGLLMSLFGVSFWSTQVPGATPDWIRQVAIYHKLYIRPTVARAVTPDTDVTQTLIANTLGKSIKIPDLSRFKVDFKRAQPLQVNDKPLLQLAYLPGTGHPLALCILRDDVQTNRSIEYGQVEGLPYAYWTSDGLGYVLVGHVDEDALQQLSREARQQLL